MSVRVNPAVRAPSVRTPKEATDASAPLDCRVILTSAVKRKTTRCCCSAQMLLLARAANFAPRGNVCANADLNVRPAAFVGMLMNVPWLPPIGQFVVSTLFARIFLEAMTVNARLAITATHSSSVQSVTDPIAAVSLHIAKSAVIVC